MLHMQGSSSSVALAPANVRRFTGTAKLRPAMISLQLQLLRVLEVTSVSTFGDQSDWSNGAA